MGANVRMDSYHICVPAEQIIFICPLHFALCVIVKLCVRALFRSWENSLESVCQIKSGNVKLTETDVYLMTHEKIERRTSTVCTCHMSYVIYMSYVNCVISTVHERQLVSITVLNSTPCRCRGRYEASNDTLPMELICDEVNLTWSTACPWVGKKTSLIFFLCRQSFQVVTFDAVGTRVVRSRKKMWLMYI